MAALDTKTETPAAPLPVILVVAPQFSFLALIICMDGLRVANRENLVPAYEWITAAETKEPVPSSSGPEILPQAVLADIALAPISILIVSYESEAACTPGLLAWLRRQDRRGGIIGCVDTAALVLARAGLLGGERIAVHHEVLAPFREEIGDAVLLDRRFAFEGRRLSSAGGMATMDMILALIENTRGRGLADRVGHAMNLAARGDDTAPERHPSRRVGTHPAGSGGSWRSCRTGSKLRSRYRKSTATPVSRHRRRAACSTVISVKHPPPITCACGWNGRRCCCVTATSASPTPRPSPTPSAGSTANRRPGHGENLSGL